MKLKSVSKNTPTKRGYRPTDVIEMIKQRTSDSGLPPVGLIAGWGAFPVEVARAIIANGRTVCCVAIKDHASGELESICDHVKWLGVGKIGGHLRYFQKLGVREVTMAGKLFKADLMFSGSMWLRHMPDMRAIRTFWPHVFSRVKDARDDSILLSVTNTFLSGNMVVCPATDFAPELLVNHGIIAGHEPNESIRRDIAAGWKVAKAMGGMDIGQSITIKDGTVLAVEAVEGTDACLERTGELCKRGGWTLVKVSKPEQDMRFDVPTIGPQTVENVQRHGGKAIAIEAGRTIVVEQEETIRAAKDAGITIISVSEQSLALKTIASDAA